MLTIPAASQRAIDSGTLDLVYYVKIETNAGDVIECATREWSGYPQTIDTVSPFSSELDPVDRKSRVGQFTITSANDGYLFDLACTKRFKYARITCLYGDMSATSTADLMPRFRGYIDKHDMLTTEGRVILTCADALSFLRDRAIVGYWINQHPLEIIQDILTNLLYLDFDPSIIDLTTLDPSNAIHDDIRHWVVSRGASSNVYKDSAVTVPTSAKSLCDELAMLMNGQLVCDEDGIIRFKRFFRGKTSVDNWTNDDFTAVPEIEDLDGNLVNEVSVHFNMIEGVEGGEISNRIATDDKNLVYTHHNSDASAALRSPDEQFRHIVSDKMETNWVEADGYLFGVKDILGNNVQDQRHVVLENGAVGKNGQVGDTFDVAGAMTHAFCGTRWPNYAIGGSPAQPSWAVVDSSHPVWLRIDNEVIRCNQVAVTTSRAQAVVIDDPSGVKNPNGESVQIKVPGMFPAAARFTIAARDVTGFYLGGAGTHFGPHASNDDFPESRYPGAKIHDITIPFTMAKWRVDRFSFGAPVLKVRTSHAKYGIQLGDIVTLTTDLIKYFDHASGLTIDDKWEVVGKQVDDFGDDPGIEWKLVWAYGMFDPDSYDRVTGVRSRKDRTLANDLNDVGADDVFRVPRTDIGDMVPQAAPGGGLNGRIGAGSARGEFQTRYSEPVDFPLNQTKDHYIIIDQRSRSVIVEEATAGGVGPEIGPGQMPAGVITTNATVVTTVRDDRNTNRVLAPDVVTANANRSVQPNRSLSSRTPR